MRRCRIERRFSGEVRGDRIHDLPVKSYAVKAHMKTRGRCHRLKQGRERELQAGELPQFRFLETVHPELPLQPNDRPLRRLQKRQCAGDYQRQPDQELEPHRRRVIDLDSERRWNDGVTDDEDHDVGRKIVGAVIGKGGSASARSSMSAGGGYSQPARSARPDGAVWRRSLRSLGSRAQPSVGDRKTSTLHPCRKAGCAARVAAGGICRAGTRR